MWGLFAPIAMLEDHDNLNRVVMKWFDPLYTYNLRMDISMKYKYNVRNNMYDFFVIYDFYKSQSINIMLLMNKVYGTYGMPSYFDYTRTFTFILGIHINILVIIETSLICEIEINPYIYIWYVQILKIMIPSTKEIYTNWKNHMVFTRLVQHMSMWD